MRQHLTLRDVRSNAAVAGEVGDVGCVCGVWMRGTRMDVGCECGAGMNMRCLSTFSFFHPHLPSQRQSHARRRVRTSAGCTTTVCIGCNVM